MTSWMEYPLISVLALAMVFLTTDPVCGQAISASQNPIPVGSNVTLSLVHPFASITIGTWLFETDTILIMYPGGVAMNSSWNSTVRFNTASGELSIMSMTLNESGLYSFNALVPSFEAQITLSVQEPVSNVTLWPNATNLVEFNDTALLTCSVATGTSLSYVWLNGSSVVTAGGRVLLSSGNAVLTIVSVSRYDVGPFRCNVSNGINNGISQAVQLTINYGPDSPWIMGPSSALTGQTVTFTCSSSSQPASYYMWSFNGSLVANTAVYMTDPLTLSMSGNYMCMAYNNVTGRSSSTRQMLTVFAPVTMASITAAASPIQNQTFSLTCQTNGSVDSILWIKDSWHLNTTDRITLSMQNTILTFNPVLLSDNGDYQCHASNSVSNLTSQAYPLHVAYGPDVAAITGPTVVRAGDSVTFTCSAMSYPPSMFMWLFNGSLIANTSLFISGPLMSSMTGMYTCTAYNNITGKNSSAYQMVKVVEPISAIQIQISSEPVVDGLSYNLSCIVTGPADYIYWMKNGVPLYANGTINLSGDHKVVTFSPITYHDNGYYYCQAGNAVSNMTSNQFNISVNFGPDNVNVTGPSVAETGTVAVFKCYARSMPPSNYYWYFNGSIVANTSHYETTPLTSNMSGKYTCMAYNNVTNKNSTGFTFLQVIDRITVMVQQNTIPINSTNLILTCEVSGPYSSIYWMKDNMTLNTNSSTNMSYYAGNNSLYFSPVTVDNDGTYTCVATNINGPHSSPEYQLLVNYGPVSIQINSVVLASLSTTWQCSADSQPTSIYKWSYSYNSYVIPDGPFLTIPDLPNNVGNYTCLATNPVTNITMTITKAFNGQTTLPIQSQACLILMALVTLSFPVFSDLMRQ